MEADTGTLLNLGCGRIKWPGWVGVDLGPRADVQADITKLPFPDDHADAIAAIHVIEHFHAWEAPVILREWRRVLKPGGRLILELPCMDKVLGYMQMCLSNKAPIAPAMGWFAFWGDPKHRDPLMVHKWGYTLESIVATLEEAGFRGAHTEAPMYHFEIRDMRAVGVK